MDNMMEFAGHPVLDQRGTEIGKISDVVYNPVTEMPEWGVVSSGTFHARHYIPLASPTYVTDSGAVVVPFDKTVVMHSPKANRDHVMTPMLERELQHHYQLVE